MVAQSAGRSGYRWLKARKECLDASRVCHLCGHDGAGEADHHPMTREELINQGLDPDDVRYLRPAHGWKSRCATCKRACNQVKGTRPGLPKPTGSRAW